MTVTFDDADTVMMNCQAIMDGKEMPEKPTTLKRVKSGQGRLSAMAERIT